MEAIFEVIIQSDKLQDFKSSVKYFINEKHCFEFLVVASIEPVNLELITGTS